MGKQSYIKDTEKFYEGDTAEKPKLDHANFSERLNEDLEDEINTEDVVKYLRENHDAITKKWPVSKSKSGKKSPDMMQSNFLLMKVHEQFKHHDLKTIFCEIVEYFDLDTEKFYKNLGTHIQTRLKSDLKKSVNLDSYHKKQRKKDIEAGGWQPSMENEGF